MVFRPLQINPVVAVDSNLVATVGHKTVTIKNHVDAVWSVLRLTNGQLSSQDVIEKAAAAGPHGRDLLASVVEDLKKLGVLVDSRELHEVVLTYSDNPMPFASDMRLSEYTGYEQTAGWEPHGPRIPLAQAPTKSGTTRRSCRGYSDKPLSVSDLAAVLGNGSDQPPSAGGLRPIRLAVVLIRPVGKFAAGVYHYEPCSRSLVPGARVSREEIQYALNREDGVHNAAAVIVVAGDMNRQTKKYSNRGWRYTLIEAGIAVERIIAAATALNLGSLAFGGYDDRALSRLLFGDDTPRVRTILTVAIGHPTNEPVPDRDLEGLHNCLDELFVGEGRPIEGAGATDLWRRPGDLSFHQVLATLRATDEDHPSPVDDRTCGGTGASIVAARAKAIVECIERRSSGNMRVDAFGPAAVVNPEFDSTPFVPLSRVQIDTSPFLTHFRQDLPLEWVSALDLHSGAETFVPIDLVYYPLSTEALGRPLIHAANSSGVASHTDPTEAAHRGLLELIERHAVLTSWHSQQPPPAVSERAMPDYLKNRRHYWRAQGYDMHVLDYTTDGVPAAGVAIGSTALFPAFAFGSAAATNWYDAAVKALHEAEVGIAGYRSLDEEPITADRVHTPIHHGRFHAYDSARTAWTFLSNAVASNAHTTPPVLDGFQEVIKRTRPLAIKIDSPDPIHTYRILSPRLYPVSFGTDLEHRPDWSSAPLMPHFIA